MLQNRNIRWKHIQVVGFNDYQILIKTFKVALNISKIMITIKNKFRLMNVKIQIRYMRMRQYTKKKLD